MDDKKWQVTTVPLCDGFFYLTFGEKFDLEKVLEKQWVLEKGFDDSKEVTEVWVKSSHEAFWCCFKKTIEMMEMIGIEKVRSDVYSDAILSPPSIGQIYNLINHKVVPSYTDLECERCGRIGHVAEVCYAETSKEAKLLETSSEWSSSMDSD